MHILIISISKKTIADLEDLNTDMEIHYVTAIENSLYKQLRYDFVFFDQKEQQQEIIKQVSELQQQEQSQWLVFNLNNNIQQSLQYLQAGASGIVYQLENVRKLTNIIQVIYQQQIYLEAELTQALALRQIKKIITPFNLLSPREFGIFCLLAEQYPIQRIADTLLISSKTAFNCQAQIRKKLNLKNQQEITQFAKKHRLIEA